MPTNKMTKKRLSKPLIVLAIVFFLALIGYMIIRQRKDNTTTTTSTLDPGSGPAGTGSGLTNTGSGLTDTGPESDSESVDTDSESVNTGGACVEGWAEYEGEDGTGENIDWSSIHTMESELESGAPSSWSVAQCKAACNSSDLCGGFTFHDRDADERGDCYFKPSDMNVGPLPHIFRENVNEFTTYVKC